MLIKRGYTMKVFDLFVSDSRGETQNIMYKTKRTITNTEELKNAVAFDNVAAYYVKNIRKNDNFIKSNCVMFDVDNTDSENSDSWITLEKLRLDFSDVMYYTVTSRNHMKEKNGKKPRPKFHVYFPIDLITDSGEYAALKDVVKGVFTYFDKYAADTARFFFGNESAEVLYFDGTHKIA
jgi:hypothetical protein